MARKIKKIEVEESPFLDLISAAGISLENIEIEKPKHKEVRKYLAKYKGFIRVLRDEESVNDYFNQCVLNGIVAVDTETNDSLDVHDNIVIGLCLYTPFNRPVYIPIFHRDSKTKCLLERQVSKEFIKEKIKLLLNLKLIYHNAKFDINVIRYNFNIHLPLYWDTLIAAKVLNENRFQNGLKFLYVEGIEPTQLDYHVTTFFENNEYADIEDFGLYSAIDPYDTFKVYEWQNKELSTVTMSKLRSLLVDLEFKVTEVCADMEWRGFDFNEQLCGNFIKTESEKLESLGNEIITWLEPYKDRILDWPTYNKGKGRGLVPELDKESGFPVKKRVKEVTTRGSKTFSKWVETEEISMVEDPYAGKSMSWPVLLTSADQVLCLLNCILGFQTNSTVVDNLKALDSPIPILIGKYRHLNHNLTSFFLPYKGSAKNGKMYAKFNQMGGEDKTVKTGRFSTTEPNLQQLPARQGEDGVRLCFGASPGKIIAGADFAAQEPRTMSSLCGEPALITGYNLRTDEFPKGKDFYATLASSAYKKDYWDCTEFDREGNFSSEGKALRQAGKVIQLGVSYGMGIKLLIKGINDKKKPGEKKMTLDEGEKMMKDFFGEFKTLAIWKDYNMARLEQFGYMETALGRRRRLFDVWLPDYNVKAYKLSPIEDVFFGIQPQIKVLDPERTTEIIDKLKKETNRFKQKDLVEELQKDPLNKIRSNGGYKSKPKTQATNFVIQGGSAELTKRALVSLYFHPEKEKLGLNILVPVHDEILVEGNMEYRDEVLRVLSECMSNSAKGLYEVNMICDGVIETCWNLGHFMDKVQKEFKKNGGDLDKIFNHHKEFSPDYLEQMALGKFNPETEYLVVNNNL